jgi:transcriptional regulator, AraC family
LLTDMQGRPIRQTGPTSSRDRDEVQAFCRKVYMPYRVRPAAPRLLPAATMRMAQVGRVTLTRFAYGVPIHLDRFDPEAGNILVLNTLTGALRHKQDAERTATTRAGDSFVVDCSRTDYWLDGDGDHLQLNLTIPHDAMAEIAMRWLGFVPDDRLWTRRLAFGGNGSRWQALLAYVVQSLEASGQVRGAPPDGAAPGGADLHGPVADLGRGRRDQPARRRPHGSPPPCPRGRGDHGQRGARSAQHGAGRRPGRRLGPHPVRGVSPLSRHDAARFSARPAA